VQRALQHGVPFHAPSASLAQPLQFRRVLAAEHRQPGDGAGEFQAVEMPVGRAEAGGGAAAVGIQQGGAQRLCGRAFQQCEVGGAVVPRMHAPVALALRVLDDQASGGEGVHRHADLLTGVALAVPVAPAQFGQQGRDPRAHAVGGAERQGLEDVALLAGRAIGFRKWKRSLTHGAAFCLV